MKEILNTYLEQNEIDKNIYEYLLNCLNSGSNTVSHSLVTESLKIDDSWIIEVEDCMASIEKIVNRPRSSIDEQREIVPVERAKRINSVSVRHLASHTEMIRNIDKKTGDVTPSRILTSYSDLTLTIYENRFVYTLINRLETFLYSKYTEIKKRIDTLDVTFTSVKSSFDVGKTRADCELKLRLSAKSKDEEMRNVNNAMLTRLEILLGRIKGYKKTEFAKACSKAKPVRPPIMKTNLLVKSVEYSKCYRLWLFLSSYKTTGFSVSVSEKQLPMDGDYYDDLAAIVASSVMTIIEGDKKRGDVFKSIPTRRRKPRNYRTVATIDYDPFIPEQPQRAQGDLVNQFYFDKIKELLEGEEVREITDKENVEKVGMSFRKFYKTLSRVNDSLCSELLDLRSNTKNGVSIPQKKAYLAEQKRILKNQEAYLKLKQEELNSLVKKIDSTKGKIKQLDTQIESIRKKRAEKRKPIVAEKSND